MDSTPEPPHSVKKWISRPLERSCGVCGGPATVIQHYGSTACHSCRAFFRRSIGLGKEYGKCALGTDTCLVDQVNRTNCRKCRLKKCIQVGMKPEKVDKSRSRKNASPEPKLKITAGCSSNSDISSFPAEQIWSIHSGHANLTEIFGVEEENINDEDEIVVNNIDIDTPADEFVEENRLFTNNSEPIPYSNNFVVSIDPVMDLTFEEEFKIYEFEAMKENMIDGCFKIYLGYPNFLENITKLMKSLSHGLGYCFSKDRMLACHKNMRNCLKNELGKGGKFRTLLDNSFYVFNTVPDEIRIETFSFSLSVVDICFRAFLKVNSDKEYILEQKKAAGIHNETFLQIVDHVFPNNRNALKSLDDYAIAIFETPWAKHAEDEDFFYHTMQAVGEIVKDDVKLGTIYIFLVLATPGAEQSQAVKTNPALACIQQEITLLLYRYLKTKHKDTEVASHTLSRLLKMVGDLHTCRNIHLFGRIEQGGVQERSGAGEKKAN